MNKLSKIFIGLMAIVVLMGVNACKKDSEGNLLLASFTCNVGSSTFTAPIRGGIIYSDKTVITGIGLDGSMIVLTIAGKESGTYEQTGAIVPIGVYKASQSTSTTDQSNYYSSALQMAKVVLTKNAGNKTLSGTFEFNAVSLSLVTKNITVGKFENITYVENPSLAPTGK